MRVAAVDLGTNSTRLLVADANGTLDEVVRRGREAGEASAARLEAELGSLTDRLEKLESTIRAEAEKRTP